MGRDPAKHRANNVAYRERHKERLERIEARRRVGRRFKLRAFNIQKKFGITLAQWNQIFEHQRRKCAACTAVEPGGRGVWATDHCHETGRIRGILCQRCNLTLGWLGDTLPAARSYVTALLAYLERTESLTPPVSMDNSVNMSNQQH